MTRKFFVCVFLVVFFLSVGYSECEAKTVRVYRDQYGVPHVYSSTTEGLF